MTEAIFSERRTRSQVTLPDSIFNVPNCSPMKGARIALRNHTVGESVGSSSDKAAADESEDELLLSPGKKQSRMETTSKGKRSASPPVQDEYPSSGSPSEGRELKRLRRDEVTSKDQRSSNGGNGERFNHSRNHSEPNIALGSRQPRQRSSATKAKKPVSTHSATVERVIFSPTPASPKKTRAQSVPLFPTSQDLPRIDLRNPPPSPKRRRSPSRSPSKEREPKLRITSLNYRLSTIEDEGNVFLDRTVGAEGSTTTPTPTAAVEETDIDVTGPKNNTVISERPATPTGPRQTQSSTTPTEIIPASPPTAEIVPASPPQRETLPSLSMHTTIGEVIPASPPSSAEYTVPTRTCAIPSTPATQSLNKLIPMSPLTPLPETPLPTRHMAGGDAEDRYAGAMGWGIEPMKELVPTNVFLKPQPTIAPSTSQSRLPRPSTTTVPSGPLLKDSRPSTTTTRQPSVPVAVTKKSLTVTQKGTSTASGSKAPKDAFAMMMKRPLEKSNAKKSTVGDKSSKAMPPPSNIFSKPVVKGKEAVAAGPSSKPEKKLKEKMKPRAKPVLEKPLVILPLSDEEEEEERIKETDSEFNVGNSANITVAGEPSSEQKEVIPEPMVSVVTESEDTVMANSSSNTSMDETPTTPHRNAEVIQGDVIPQQSVEAEATTTADTLPVEVQAPKTEILLAEATIEPSSAPTETLAHVDIEEPSTQTNNRGLQDADMEQPPVQATKDKFPLGKKRQPASIPAPVRVTRSVSNRKTTETEGSQIAGPSNKKPTTRPAPTKRIPSDSTKKPVPTVEVNEDVAMDVIQDRDDILPPGSPMKTTPAKPSKKASSTEHTLDDEVDMISSISTPSKLKLPPSPSPTKIARSTLMAMRPTAASIARTFSSSSLHSQPNSSLSTLSNALEKLRMPAPSRPSTSMGFNRDIADDDSTSVPVRSKDDVAIGRPSIGRSDGIQRSATLGSNAFKPTSSTASKASGSGARKMVQKPLSNFMANKGAVSKQPAAGARRLGALGNKSSIFGVGGGPRRTISKKTTLPVVIGSPVKGGGKAGGETDGAMQEDNEDGEENEEEGGKIFNAIMNGGSATQLLENLLAQGSDKGKEKETSNRAAHSSRRVSMLSRDLTQSLNTVPSPPLASATARGMMGPPATPPSSGRVNRTMGSGSGSSASGSPSQGPKRSARIASAAPKATNDASIAAGKKAAAEPSNPAKKILKDCVIFVDVKSEDGDEAGSLFIEMLEGVGARVLTRVGQTCTHIVFKNGLMSTITRYKLLREPKPIVVGIGWVVECIEQMKLVDEKDFLVDLERINMAGTHKRRRSMLPRLFAEEETEQDESGDGDRSMDGSVSSVTMEDDLTPLERARRRKSILTGPRP